MSSPDFIHVMQEGLTRLLQCGICQERFKAPRVLPCHHTFCSDCMERQTSSGEIVCPECITSHQLPALGVRSFADDSRIASLLELQERWQLGFHQESRAGAGTKEMNSLKTEFHKLRASVEDFNRCTDLWERVQQSAEEDLVGMSNGKQIDGALRLLRKRRRLLHQKLDEFLREETASVQSRVKCEFTRASEYCSFVEGRLKNFEKQPAITELNHMRGQCVAILQQTSGLLSTICEQTAKMPLKIVKASDDIKSPVPRAFYGVDVGVQVSTDDDLARKLDRTHSLPPIGYVPPLRSRRNSSDSDSTICSRKSIFDLYGGRVIMNRSNSDSLTLKKPRGYGDIHKMKVFGRSWFQGGKKRSILGPAGVAVVRDSLVAVTDTANGCVRLCTSSGLSPRRVLTHDGIFTNFGNPQAICVDLPQRHLYVTDKDNACVVALDIDTGEDVNTITCAGHRPIGVALDSDSDTLYICCEETHAVVMYRTDGTLVGQIGERGREPGQFLYPHSLAISPDNRLWVTDTNNNRIQVFTLAGKFVKTVGARGSGLGQLNHPKGLTIDDRGFVMVADTGNQRVQIFDSTGKSLLVFGREDGTSAPSMGGLSPLKPSTSGGGGSTKVSRHQGVAGPVGVASTGSQGVRGKVFVSYQGDPRIVAYLVQYQR
ncbi:RING finger protein nhl-1-like [Patiria miniata]|uniref:RING-type domain-containing protein n=1 Tax=Patiria miniata TaxID=46514 RepID=A0A913YZP5_PATMI|nr:RING finger protein nhl-1-like [Patiria miniata]